MTSIDEIAAIADEAADLGLPAPPPVRRQRFGELAALRWGDGPARVVLLHGGGLNAHTWDGTLARWRVDALALDLPGHGESPWRDDGDYSPRVGAPTVRAALDAAVAAGALADAPVLVGQSLGGLTALALVGDGLSVAHVVLVDALPLPPEAGSQVAAFLAAPATFASREQIVERALAFGLGGSPRRLERAVALNTRVHDDGTVSWKHHLGVLAGQGLLRLRTDDEALWAALRDAPAAVDLVRGERGIVGPALLERLSRERPAARVVTLDAGHNLQEDVPVELADTLVGLLAPRA